MDRQRARQEAGDYELRRRGYGENVAALRCNAFVNNVAASGAVRPHLMLREEYNDVTGSSGFSWVAQGQYFEVQLARSYLVNAIQVTTWHEDNRTYTLQIQISNDHKTWEEVHNGPQPNQRGGCEYTFPERDVKYIRLSGTNTANAQLHILKLSVYNNLDSLRDPVEAVPEVRPDPPRYQAPTPAPSKSSP
eukprot:m.255252 g.255252  ORF g.255252 m.255252 type:complete len:191 (+) comp19268_c0_seq1:441-1013(+)